jgi:hypothetical protein
MKPDPKAGHLKLPVSTRSSYQEEIPNCTVLQAHTWIGKYLPAQLE